MNYRDIYVNNTPMKNFNNNKEIKSNKFEKIKIIINHLLLMISIGILIYFCVENNNLINLINILPSLNVYWLIAAFLSMIVCWYFDSKVLEKLTRLIYYKSYGKLFFFKITMTGQYFTALTPMGVAGQPMQVFEFFNHGVSKHSALIIITRKFFVYQSSLVIYSILCGVFRYNYVKISCPELIPLFFIGILFQSSLVILIWIFSINRRFVSNLIKFGIRILSGIKIIKNKEETFEHVEEKLDFFIKSNKFISKNRKANFELYILSFLQITFLFLVPFFVFKSFQRTETPIMEILSTQSIINTISSFTPLPGAAGTAEKGFLILFKSFFYENEVAIAMIISRLVNFYFAIVLGFIFYKLPFKKSRNIANEFKRRR